MVTRSTQTATLYVSVYGDSWRIGWLNRNVRQDDAETQAELAASKQTFEQALSTFTVETHKAVTAAGKHPVVWEEMVLAHNVTLVNGTVVLYVINTTRVDSCMLTGSIRITGCGSHPMTPLSLLRRVIKSSMFQATTSTSTVELEDGLAITSQETVGKLSLVRKYWGLLG